MKPIPLYVLIAITALSASCSGSSGDAAFPIPIPGTEHFTVTYDDNGADSGAVPTDASAYLPGSNATVLGNTGGLVKAGSSFAGWNTTADGKGTSYTVGTQLTITGSITLYAAWTALPTYSLSYNKNGADSGAVPTDASAYLPGSNATVLGNTGGLVKAGFSFGGWNTKDDAQGTAYAPGASVPIGTESVILFAVWTVSTGSGGITVVGPGPVSIALTAPATAAFGAGFAATATAGTTVDAWSWYLDGELVAGQTTNSFAGGTALIHGPHTIMAVARIGAIPYSASSGVTVQ